MKTLVLTVIGDDRVGLVEAVARIVYEHGGNWENSELAELAGAFAGVIEVSVPLPRGGAPGRPRAARRTPHRRGARRITRLSQSERRHVTFGVLGNDHPGIVREISAALQAHGSASTI